MTPKKKPGIATAIARAAGSLEFCLAFALIVAVGMNVLNVIGRYIFGWSVSGVDELQIYLLMALAFFGSVVATVRGQHLRMDVLNRYFPSGMKRFLASTEAVGATLLSGFVCFISTSYVIKMFAIGTVSENAHIPMWIPHSLIAVAFGLLALVNVTDIFLRLCGTSLTQKVEATSDALEVNP